MLVSQKHSEYHDIRSDFLVSAHPETGPLRERLNDSRYVLLDMGVWLFQTTKASSE